MSFLDNAPDREQALKADWTLGARLYFAYFAEDKVYEILPASVRPPLGQIGNPITDEKHGGLETSAVYKGLDDHQIRLGAGYKNFNFPGFKPCVAPADLFSQPTHITDPECLYMPSTNRNLWYTLAQDEWQLASKWL